VARATAKMGARVDSDPSISPLSAGWTRVRRNDWVAMGSGEIMTASMVLLLLIWVLPPLVAIQPMLPAGRPAVVVPRKRLLPSQGEYGGVRRYRAGSSRKWVRRTRPAARAPLPGGL
jgi:hypothetical protein